MSGKERSRKGKKNHKLSLEEISDDINSSNSNEPLFGSQNVQEYGSNVPQVNSIHISDVEMLNIENNGGIKGFQLDDIQDKMFPLLSTASDFSDAFAEENTKKKQPKKTVKKPKNIARTSRKKPNSVNLLKKTNKSKPKKIEENIVLKEEEDEEKSYLILSESVETDNQIDKEQEEQLKEKLSIKHTAKRPPPIFDSESEIETKDERKEESTTDMFASSEETPPKSETQPKRTMNKSQPSPSRIPRISKSPTNNKMRTTFSSPKKAPKVSPHYNNTAPIERKNINKKEQIKKLINERELLKHEIQSLEAQKNNLSTMTNEDISVVTKYQGIVLTSVNEYIGNVIRSVKLHNAKINEINKVHHTINKEIEHSFSVSKAFSTVKFSTNKLKENISNYEKKIEDLKNEKSVTESVGQDIITSKACIEAEASDLTYEEFSVKEELEEINQQIESIKKHEKEQNDKNKLLSQEKYLRDEIEVIKQKIEEINNSDKTIDEKEEKEEPIDRSLFDLTPKLLEEKYNIQQSYYNLQKSMSEDVQDQINKLSITYNTLNDIVSDEDVAIYDELKESEESYTNAIECFNICAKGCYGLQTKLINEEFDKSNLELRVNALASRVKESNKIRDEINGTISTIIDTISANQLIKRICYWCDSINPECKSKLTVAEKIKYIQSKI